VGYSSVEDVHSVDAALDRIGAVGELGKHSAADHSRIDEGICLGYGKSSDEGALVVKVSVESLNVGKEYELVGTECGSYRTCGIVRVDVVGIVLIVHTDGRNDGKEIVIEEEPEDLELLEQWLTGKRGRSVHIRVPKIGSKEHLIQLAKQNAELVLKQDLDKLAREEKRTRGAAEEIAGLLGLSDVHRMESYDISNISGFLSVGSMVVFADGKPRKSEYRKFRIQSVEGPNDYASMEEVLTRRFRHGMEERAAQKESSFTRYPDLILMDGGKGQVHIAEEVLNRLGLSIPVAGMVKDDSHRTRGLYFRDVELPIDTHGEGFALLTRIQDETHRFAITYHKNLRSAGQIHSKLDEIPGVGPTRRKTLMRYYENMDSLRNASAEEIAALPGMNAKVAQQIVEFLKK
jgi:excinuclease ABC subunit C